MLIYMHGINMSNTNAAEHVHAPIKAHIPRKKIHKVQPIISLFRALR